MRSLSQFAMRLSLGFVLTGSFVFPPAAPAVAGPKSVINKLERFLNGRTAKARSQNRKTRSTRKARDRKAGRQQAGATTKEKRRDAEGSPVAPSPKSPPKLSPASASQTAAVFALPALVAVPQFRPDIPPAPEQPAQVAESQVAPPLPTPAPRTEPETEGPDPLPHLDRGTETAANIPPAADETACRAQLRTLNVAFEERPPESDAAAGCSIPHPIFVTRLSKTVKLEPGGLMNCAMTEAAARFVRDVVQPAALEAMGGELTGIGQASAYVCRTRHGRSKLSEHAFGNALDIARFSFANGTVADVGPKPGEQQSRFLAEVRAAACGPFKTVLGPGSDPDHEFHFHLDLAHRRNGSTFCQ